MRQLKLFLLMSIVIFFGSCYYDDMCVCCGVEDNIIESNQNRVVNYFEGNNRLLVTVDSTLQVYNLTEITYRKYMVEYITDNGCDGLSQVNLTQFSDSSGNLEIGYKLYLRHPDSDNDYKERLEVHVLSKELGWDFKKVFSLDDWTTYPNKDTILIEAKALEEGIVKVKYSQFGINEIIDDKDNSIIRLPQ